MDQKLIKKMISDKAKPIIRAQDLPYLVRFTNIDDPAPIEEVQPPFLNDSFGLSAKLVSINYQVTDMPIILHKIRSVLPWLSYHRGRFRPGSEVGSRPTPDFGGFNRTIVYRINDCLLDDHIVNNLTYGLWWRGIHCTRGSIGNHNNSIQDNSVSLKRSLDNCRESK